VALPEPLQDSMLPHIESDGLFCIVSSHSAYTIPVGISHLEELIRDANNILEQGRSGKNESDFYTEAQSYWKPDKASQIWLTCPPPENHSVLGCAISGSEFIVALDNQSATGWANVSGRKVEGIQTCLLIRLPNPLHPEKYPVTMKQLFALIYEVNALPELNRALNEWNTKHFLPIVILFEYNEQAALLGCALTPPQRIRMPNKQKNGIPGFRINSRIRPDLLISALSQVPDQFHRLKVVPTFRKYLQTRTSGNKMAVLSSKHIIIAGCGSLGGHLAVQLAQTGVGKLTLLDDDTFDWANVGRHVLNGSDVGKYKAKALQENIRQRFPDMEVIGVSERWEIYRQQNEDIFDSADLIISVTGDAASNLHLDYLMEEREIPPVIFGWIEAFGTAAHAIFRDPNGGQLKDICDEYGRLKEPVSDLKSMPSLPTDSSCGAFYQPYSSIAALYAIAHIGELAIDVLRVKYPRSIQRTWVGNSAAFFENGLSVTPNWSKRLNPDGYNKRFDTAMPRKEYEQ